VKIIIAGAGEVGKHLAKMLSQENHDIVVIDPEMTRIEEINTSFDILTINGSATSFEILKEVDVKDADLFIAVTHYEETNIVSAILGKKLGAGKTIARVDNMEYLMPVYRDVFESMGIDSLIYPELIAAREIISLIHQAGTTDFYDFTGGKLSLYVIRLDEESPIIGNSLFELDWGGEDSNYRAIAITRDNETIIPRGTDRFRLNDTVYVIANRHGMKGLSRFTGKEEIDVNNIMILGGSRIGKRTAENLEKQFNIKLIEINREKCTELADFLEDTLVINGDGRDIDLLLEEGLKTMDVFIAVTGNSETNILSCQLAKKMGVPKVIAEVENIDYIPLAENIGIDTIINKKLITASRIFRFTTRSEVSAIKCLTGTDAEVLEYVVKKGSRITKAPLKDLDFPKGAIVGGVIRGKQSFIALGDTFIKPHDRVVVFTLPASKPKVEKFFK